MAEWFRVVYSGGPRFNASTLPLAGFASPSAILSSNPRSCFINSQLVCLLPVGIFKYVTFI